MTEPKPTYAHEKPANKSIALEQALRKLEKAKAALKQIRDWQGHNAESAIARDALKELDDA